MLAQGAKYQKRPSFTNDAASGKILNEHNVPCVLITLNSHSTSNKSNSAC